MATERVNVHYDKQTDVLYVDIDIEEPTVSEPLGKGFYLEMGYTSHRFAGFRVLEASKKQMNFYELVFSEITKCLRSLQKEKEQLARKEELLLSFQEVLTEDSIKEKIHQSV